MKNLTEKYSFLIVPIIHLSIVFSLTIAAYQSHL